MTSANHGDGESILAHYVEEADLKRIRESQPDKVNREIDKLLNPPTEPDDSPVDEIRCDVQDLVAGGFWSRETIVEQVTGTAATDHNKQLVRCAVETITSDEIEKHLEQQARWPDVTDCDRLDRAFEQLNQEGVLACQNAPCCETCAGGFVTQELEEQNERGRNLRGYVFYHEQDTTGAQDGQLYLSYGPSSDDTDDALDVARHVCNVLQHHGLRTEWDGTITMRIGVILNWQKRTSFERDTGWHSQAVRAH